MEGNYQRYVFQKMKSHFTENLVISRVMLLK